MSFCAVTHVFERQVLVLPELNAESHGALLACLSGGSGAVASGSVPTAIPAPPHGAPPGVADPNHDLSQRLLAAWHELLGMQLCGTLKRRGRAEEACLTGVDAVRVVVALAIVVLGCVVIHLEKTRALTRSIHDLRQRVLALERQPVDLQRRSRAASSAASPAGWVSPAPKEMKS